MSTSSARSLAQQLATTWVSRSSSKTGPGRAASSARNCAAKSPPDGYTLLAVANTFAMVPSIVSNPGYDPLKRFRSDLADVSRAAGTSRQSRAAGEISEGVDRARQSAARSAYVRDVRCGGTGHMATELFSRQVGVKMLHVPSKGNAQAIIDVIGGQVMLMFDQVSTSDPYIKSGKLRPLAVSSLKRSPLFPNLPTIDEAGVPGFEDITFNGLVAPAGTPRELLVRVNQEVAKVVSIPALRNRFIERGVELKASASPEAILPPISRPKSTRRTSSRATPAFDSNRRTTCHCMMKGRRLSGRRR